MSCKKKVNHLLTQKNMPNWCANTLSISHEDTSTWKWFLSTRFDFEKISPQIKVTEDNYIELINRYKDEIGIYEKRITEHEDFDALDLKERKELCDKLEFDLRSLKCWGTKWKVDIDEEVFIKSENGNSTNVLCFSFCSAWGPPYGIYNKLNEMGFKLSANFEEKGCDFIGTYRTKDGELEKEIFSYSMIRNVFFEYRKKNKDKEDYNEYKFLKIGVEKKLFSEGVADMLDCEIEVWIEEAEEEEEEEVEETNE